MTSRGVEVRRVGRGRVGRGWFRFLRRRDRGRGRGSLRKGRTMKSAEVDRIAKVKPTEEAEAGIPATSDFLFFPFGDATQIGLDGTGGSLLRERVG